jgi:YVTN family beta-propeller protein
VSLTHFITFGNSGSYQSKNVKLLLLILMATSPTAIGQSGLPKAGANGTLTGSREGEPLRSVTNPGAPTTRQSITPAGIQTVIQGRIHAVAFGPKSSEIWLLRDGADRFYNGDLIQVDWKQNRILERIPIGGTPGLQGLAWDGAQNRLLVTVAAAGKEGAVSLLQVKDELTKVAAGFGTTLSGAPAPSSRRVVVPLTFNDQLAVLDASSGALEGRVPVGVSPFAAAIDSKGDVAWVSNWGGRIPKPGETSAPLGTSQDRAVVDARGIAASGTVQRIDLNTRRVTHTLETGLHPTALAWDLGGARLYVANSNADSITVIDTALNRVVGTFPLDFFDGPAFGIAPTALALSPDGKRLWVACGGINAVAQFLTEDGLQWEGLIPTAYYPHTLAVSRDGGHILVGTFFGVGEGSVEKPNERHPFACRSTAHVIEVPEPDQLAAYTAAVAENTHLALKGTAVRAMQTASQAEPLPVPRRAGDDSLIQHIVYIIKENETYDAFFGGVAGANGDPSLALFGPEVAPNHHKLAQGFVLFDNFYSTGYHSHDGHAWMTQANTVAYLLWPGWTGRGFPFDGTDPLSYSRAGFLWNPVLALGKTVRDYGELVPAGRNDDQWVPDDRDSHRTAVRQWQAGEDFSKRFHVKADIEPLNSILAENYPSFTLGVPDVVRAQIFLKDLARWNEAGEMPNLVILQLPMDHTVGVRPGWPTPKTCVADNDLALGLIVEGLTKSKFWPKMAIFVAEDDGLNALDHVDGRRIAAFAISPYTRRGIVDSTFYSQTSMVKTIELMLGVEPMTLFDRIATDMRAAFTSTPNLAPYSVEIPRQPLTEENPETTALRGKERKAAAESARMDFTVPDAAPMARLSRIIWYSVRGWDAKYPAERRAAFLPGGATEDDDDR